MKRALSFLLISALLCSALALPAAADLSGKCGDGLAWSFDAATGTLSITGEGDMYDYNVASANPPWSYNWNEITSVRVGEGVTSLGDHALYYCGNMTSLTLPSTLQSIGDLAFYCAGGLTSLNLPAGVEELGERLFGQFSNLAHVSVAPANGCFRAESGVLYSKDGAELVLYPRAKTDAAFSVPSGVKRIADNAFAYTENLRSVYLPSGLESIGAGAFERSFIASVSIPERVTEIGESAFAHSLIATAKLPSGMSVVPARIFAGCAELSSVTLPERVEVIENGAFMSTAMDVTKLLPDTLRYIGASALACGGESGQPLELVIPDSVEYIGASAFNKHIPAVRFGKGLREIDDKAFYGCNVSRAEFSEGLVRIGKNAFFRTLLTEVSLPNSLKYIDDGAFDECERLKSVTFGESLLTIGVSAFGDCSIGVLTIPERVREIGSNAFKDNRISSLTLGKSLASIGSAAFMKNYCRSVTVPASVLIIGEDCFSQAEKLAELRFEGEHDIMFKDIEGVAIYSQTPCTVYGPSGTNIKEMADAHDHMSFVSTGWGRGMPFGDVAKNDWFYESAKLAYLSGVVTGVTESSFAPYGGLTAAQAVTMAARVYNDYTGDGHTFAQSDPWYESYVSYAVEKGIVEPGEFADISAPLTRREMAGIFARAVPAHALMEKNTVKALPDVAEDERYGKEIFMLYRAGVLTGNDSYGTFSPDSPVTRAEAAAIITRVLFRLQRQSFYPAKLPA